MVKLDNRQKEEYNVCLPAVGWYLFDNLWRPLSDDA